MSWKGVLKFVVGFILTIGVIVGLGMLFLPEKVVITQKATLAATEENLNEYFSDLQQWPTILPWLSANTAHKTEFTLKKGKCMRWQYLNSQAYQGNVCVLEESENDQVEIEISFDGKSSFFHALKFKQLDALHTELSWTGSSEHLRGFEKWEYIFLKQWLKHDIGIAFQNLPVLLASAGKTTAWVGNVNEFLSPDSYLVFKTDTLNLSEIEDYLPKTWTAVRADALSNGLETWDSPYCIFRYLDAGLVAVEAGVILKKESPIYNGKFSGRFIKGDSLMNIDFRGPIKNYQFAVDSLRRASASKGYTLEEEVIVTYKDTNQTITKLSPMVPMVVTMTRKSH